MSSFLREHLESIAGEMPTPAVLASLAAVAGGAAWGLSKAFGRSLPLPPGPKPLPILGNLFDIPTEKPWLTFDRWIQTYGDIVHVQASGQHFIIVGSGDVAQDLLERRSAIYSDRHQQPMIHDLMGFAGYNILFYAYGERWRRSRRLYNDYYRAAKLHDYEPTQMRSVHALARRLQAGVPDVHHALREYTGSSLMTIVYGERPEEEIEEWIQTAEDVNSFINAGAVPGAYWVDFLPILKYVPAWMPGAGFQKEAKRCRATTRKMCTVPWAATKKDIAAGTNAQCVAGRMLEDLYAGTSVATEEECRDAAGVTFTAANESTLATITAFLLAMILHPEVQTKAHAELDRIIGVDRLPTLTDRESLPYITALILEVMRWSPAVPVDIPHKSTEDDYYNGQLIPKGSLVLVNTWSILHNPDDYPAPDAFLPERFLRTSASTGEPELDPGVRDPRNAGVFGFGRRGCSGRHFAEQSLFLTVATVLAAVCIEKAVGKDGKPVVPEFEMQTGTVAWQKPFDCVVKPRSQRAVELVQSTSA